MWHIVPPIATKFFLSQYYSWTIANKSLRPQEGSALYQRHYIKMYSFVTICYFIYCMGTFIYELKPDYYVQIGLHREDIDLKLKKHFKNAIIHLHPDKVGGADPDAFLLIKQLYEVLSNFDTRCAYDCYGPGILSGVNMSSSKASSKVQLSDYFTQALYEWIAFYAGTAIIFVLSSLGMTLNMLYWRFTALFLFSFLEIYVLMRPTKFGVATPFSYEGILLPFSYIVRMWNQVPVHIKLAFMRQLYIYGGMAIGKIASLFSAGNIMDQIKVDSKHLNILASGALVKEAQNTLTTSMESVKNDPSMRELLKQKMSKMIVDLQISELMDSTDKKRLQTHLKKQ